MTKVILYTKAQCPYCDKAKEFLKHRNIAFAEIRIDLDPSKRDEMLTKSNRRTVPQIFINDRAIGGYDDMMALVKTGEFETFLNS